MELLFCSSGLLQNQLIDDPLLPTDIHHRAANFQLLMEPEGSSLPHPALRRDFHRADFEGIVQSLGDTDCNNFFHDKSVDSNLSNN